MTKEQWGQLKQELLGTVGKHNFANWIEPLELSDVSDGVATFNVPTTFTGNYVSRNFGDLILFQVNTVSPDIRRVHFRVPANATIDDLKDLVHLRIGFGAPLKVFDRASETAS